MTTPANTMWVRLYPAATSAQAAVSVEIVLKIANEDSMS
jgi:hypothetical protein